MASVISLLLAFLLVLVPAMSFNGIFNIWPHRAAQTPLLDSPGFAHAASNFSVGFTLQSSFGAVAVIFEYPNGTSETVVRTLEGDAVYRAVMTRLSLDSSQHLA